MKNLFLLVTVLLSSTMCFAQQRSDRKIIEVKKIISITEKQEKQIRKAHDQYNTKVDHALFEVDDPYKAAQIKYEANKEFNETFMAVLTEKQRNQYIRITSTPEIQIKTQAKVDLLLESGEYSDKEIEQMKEEIFEYMMAEKVVYTRDKHNYKKQKDNIARLKQIQPKSLKESNTREKLHAQGRIKRGKVNW